MYTNHLSNEEQFRMTGTLTPDRIGDLLDTSETTDLDAAKVYIEEAEAQYPAEDFLSGVIERLHALAKRVRGDNRDEVQSIAEALDDLAQTTVYATEEGMSNLTKAKSELGTKPPEKS